MLITNKSAQLKTLKLNLVLDSKIYFLVNFYLLLFVPIFLIRGLLQNFDFSYIIILKISSLFR